VYPTKNTDEVSSESINTFAPPSPFGITTNDMWWCVPASPVIEGNTIPSFADLDVDPFLPMSPLMDRIEDEDLIKFIDGSGSDKNEEDDVMNFIDSIENEKNHFFQDEEDPFLQMNPEEFYQVIENELELDVFVSMNRSEQEYDLQDGRVAMDEDEDELFKIINNDD